MSRFNSRPKIPKLAARRVELANFGVAIEEDAMLVRVGSAIFGKRTPARQRAQAAFDPDE